MPSKNELRFVIHKHAATHLHYDLRLEIGGVLASWAVPKGIPKKINQKHLAIKMPDHALSYIDFAGTIEEGEYGAGTVEIWDSGIFFTIKEDNEGNLLPLGSTLKKGIMELIFEGKKIKGRYALVRTRLKGKSTDQEQWLFIKLSSKK